MMMERRYQYVAAEEATNSLYSTVEFEVSQQKKEVFMSKKFLIIICTFCG